MSSMSCGHQRQLQRACWQQGQQLVLPQPLTKVM